MKTKYFIWISFVMIFCCLSACKKTFLDAKPAKSLLVPTSLADMQALLDNNLIMNNVATSPMLRTDELYSTNSALSELSFNCYTFSARVWVSDLSIDWNKPFQQIFYANVVLDALKWGSIKVDDQYNSIKGAAYLFRATAYYNLLQEFCKPYLAATSQTELGMPIRLDADVNKNPPRSSLSETYNQVVADFKQAAELLPVNVQIKTRPSRAAAFAMLAKTFLAMNDFVNAELYAETALANGGALIDFNTLNPAASRPFPSAQVANNPELVFWLRTNSFTFLNDATTLIPDSVYSSYDSDDLRKVIYFNVVSPGRITFKGSASGTLDNFNGIANDELYLIRAECAVRNNKLPQALADLNLLLTSRYKTGRFTPYSVSDRRDLLALILKERFKELIYRGTRWTDLRRLNSFDNAGYVINRVVYGQTYTLPANGSGYVFPIPLSETNLSGIQ